MALASILEKHYTPSGVLGANTSKASLQSDLGRYGALQGVRYAIVFVCVLFLFVLSAYFAVTKWHEPQQLQTLVGALGVTVGGAFEALRRVSSEWGRTSLLLTLIKHADEARVQVLIEELMSSLRPGR